MKKNFLILSLLCITAIAYAQEKPTSKWASTPITVDGNGMDWNLPLKNYDESTKLFFDIKNDSTNLYLCFQSSDQMTQTRILRLGMKILLVSKINGKHKEVIDFPLPYKHTTPDATANETQARPDFSQMRQNMRATFLASDTVMEVKGFASQSGTIPSYTASGIRASINWSEDNTVMTYELAIPLKEMFGNDYDPKEISKEISLSTIINAKEFNSGVAARENRSADETGRSSMGTGSITGGGMGGYRGGGGRMGSGHGGQFQSGREAMAQKSEFKQKFTLATNS